tara:strand:+ start:6995 stop:7624 length:630 start_codon:yes stop_codon:yes gene_type:complete
MATSHWLDPFARKLLRVTGNLPGQGERTSTPLRECEDKEIETELQKLKSKYSNKTLDPSLLIDVNRATAYEWQRLPGCSRNMIDLLIRLQRGGVQLSSKDDLIKLLNLPKHLAEQWSPHLVFRWYGNSPKPIEMPLLDINCASPKIVSQTLRWPKERVKRLIRERERSPFHHLADLQERLTLPADVIEDLIGSVCFRPKKAGPELPPNQ